MAVFPITARTNKVTATGAPRASWVAPEILGGIALSQFMSNRTAALLAGMPTGQTEKARIAYGADFVEARLNKARTRATIVAWKEDERFTLHPTTVGKARRTPDGWVAA